jgi:phosphatidylglycerophosphate synthase
MSDVTDQPKRSGIMRFLPLTRVSSAPFIRLFAALPITANQITALSLIMGVWACYLFYLGEYKYTLLAAVLFTLSYILDNCDGAIARLKGLTSEFGKRFDTFVDWFVNNLFFVMLGWGEWVRTDQSFWFWCGAAAAFGGTVNYIIDQIRDTQENAAGVEKVKDGPDDSLGDQTVYTSRVIRSDFCFIVLALALFDLVWLLLPASAIGAQVYWGLQFMKGFRRHHV